MPRYFFHFRSNDKSLLDCQGLRLAGADAARQEAVRTARDFWQSSAGRVAPEWEGWWIEVRDERGRRVCFLPLAEVPSCEHGEEAKNEPGGPRVVNLDLERAKREFTAVENEARDLFRRTAMLIDRNRYEAKGLYVITRAIEQSRQDTQQLLARSRDQRASNDWVTVEKPCFNAL